MDRLKAATRRSVFQAMARQAAVGKVSAQRVALQRAMPMFGNSFKPFFIGRFIEREGRVFLVGQFRVVLPVRIFMAFWFGVLALMALLSVTRAPSSHARWAGLLAAIGMATLGMAMVAFGKWLARNDPAWISAIIEGALSAAKAPTPLRPAADRGRTRLIGAVCLLLAIVCWLPLFIPGTPTPGSWAHPFRILPALSAIDGAVLLIMAYGAFRRELFAWRLGFAFLGLAWLQTALEATQRSVRPRPSGWAEIAFVLAALLITAAWGWWWYVQREYWLPEAEQASGPP
ncbi:MAG: hypothetical protein WAU49_09630 [Steroidobacteraceae bacterium]